MRVSVAGIAIMGIGVILLVFGAFSYNAYVQQYSYYEKVKQLKSEGGCLTDSDCWVLNQPPHTGSDMTAEFGIGIVLLAGGTIALIYQDRHQKPKIPAPDY